MASPDRQELIRNAVSFLSDTKAQASPLAQKLQFLEAKGLTPAEIDIALKQSAQLQNGPYPQQYASPYSHPHSLVYPPQQQRWDWRDYFITAVVSGTVVYGAVSMFKKYLYPHLQPPSTTAYEQDRDELNAQFDAAEALLKEIQAETAAVRAAVEEQKERVDQTTENVNAVVTQMKEGEAKTRDEIREIREEVNTIRDMLPKMIDKNKESQTQSLSELQQELKSLKALLLSRGPSVPSVPSPPMTFGRPAIPAWQLASTPQTANTDVGIASSASVSQPIPPPTTSNSSYKGKEPERDPSRSTTPDPNSRGTSSNSANAPRKSNLEERLRRAAFAIGEASNPSTGPPSKRASPSPTPDRVRSLRPSSPASTPLPPSPALHPLAPETKQPTTNDVPELQLETEKLPEATGPETIPSVDETTTVHSAAASPDAPSPAAAADSTLDPSPSTSVTIDPLGAVEGELTQDQGSPPPLEGPTEDDISSELTSQDVSVSPPDVVATEEHVSEKPPINETHASPDPEVVVEDSTPGENVSTNDNTAKESAANDGPSEPVKEDGSSNSHAVEELQQRLKQVEQRFADVSTSFKRLQAEKRAADSVLREFTPLETIQDNEGLRDYLKNLKTKMTVFQEEVNRLNHKAQDYEGRLEDLQKVHVSETKSQAEQLDRLRTQFEETEALFQASEKAMSRQQDGKASHKAEVDQLRVEMEKFKTQASQEEEKRVKAISLLKTVRQKLVKAEKERDEALHQSAASRDGEQEERERERTERLKLQHELEALQIDKEKTLAANRAQFDRELTLMKDRHDKELSAVKGQLELDIITLRASHSKDVATKSSQISALENSLNNVTRDKNTFFEQLQIKQAETESAQGHLESLQLQNTELEFQLREANDRLALLREEYTEYHREQEVRAREPVTSADDIAQMISATESKYEIKLSEAKRSLEVLEKERAESEAKWSSKMKEKIKEVDELNRALGTTAKSREEDIDIADKLRNDLDRANQEIRSLREEVSQISALQDSIQELKKAAKDQEQAFEVKDRVFEKQVEEYRSREAQLKQANKTLKEELRKVQSSAALLERQRNPGVGYWNRSGVDSPASTSFGQHSPDSPSPQMSAPARNSSSAEEEVNLEYLRNVILQFLEHKEMRPNLVKVISIILHFTPQETRRLMAKV
ncbi:hypothetical protein FA15DRAFT_683828 [Coprinopsis marcescibilis]|uniref:Peroxisomal membrane protein PEX14 n=1 Tax=Coprinopsis marcescibilis TaxID=230819 RepID=A0A5C3LP58_COPMA|nr:hypothetical protein FA15DRAFT_683828 [Coprinopsis marcescibilis]